MVDEVSPIVYKKMSILNFLTEEEKRKEKESEIEEEEQEDDDLEDNLVKVKPNKDLNKQILEHIRNNDPKLFYDSVSKQVIYVGKSGIKIFNKNVTVLRKEINLRLASDKIFKIAVDKEIKYMLIFLKKGQTRIILIVSLKKGLVIQYITGNLHQLLGMFFIFNSQSLNIKKGKETYFSLVYQDKIYYYKITIADKKDTLDKVEFINQVSYPGYIKKYIYNQKYMILTIQRLDKELTFDFYNLSSPKYYSRFFPFELPNTSKINNGEATNNSTGNTSKNENKNDNSPIAPTFFNKMANFFNSGNVANDNLKKEPIINNKENYKENHFLLDSIYRKIYFIYVNYDIGYVQFFKVKNLYNISKVYEIQFESTHENTVQFIDNLILIHDFETMTSRIIDIKCSAKNKELFHKFPISSYEIIKNNGIKTFENLKQISEKLRNPEQEKNEKEKKEKKEEKEEKKIQIEIKEEKNDNIEKEEKVEEEKEDKNDNIEKEGDKEKEENEIEKIKEEKKEENENEKKEINKVSMLAYTNTMFYDKDLRLNGSTIQRAIHSIDDDNNTSDDKTPILYFLLYNIYFDTLIYYEYADSKFEALINLTRRKHSKEVIINGLYEMIKSNRDIKLIRQIFKCIVKQIVKNHLKHSNSIKLNEKTEKKGELLMSQLETFREPSELPIPFQYTIFKKKDLINQMDIYTKLFNTIENNSKIVKPEYAITIMLLFADELKLQRVPLHPQFNKILVSFLKKISNFFTANIYFQYFSFPDSLFLAKFLIYDIGLNKGGNYTQENREQAIQHGLDMLKRQKKYNEIFKYFIESNQLYKAMNFYKKYKKYFVPLKTINEEDLLVKEMLICNEDDKDEEKDEKENGVIKKIEDFYQQEQDEQEESIIRQYSQKKQILKK